MVARCTQFAWCRPWCRIRRYELVTRGKASPWALVNRGHLDTADTLGAMCDEHLVLAHAVHCAPGAHRVQPESTAMRTVVDSVRSVRWMCCAGDDG